MLHIKCLLPIGKQLSVSYHYYYFYLEKTYYFTILYSELEALTKYIISHQFPYNIYFPVITALLQYLQYLLSRNHGANQVLANKIEM